MKTYRIKKDYANVLRELPGLEVGVWRRNQQTIDINVYDYSITHYSGLTYLPKNCNNQLVHTILGQMQGGETTLEQVKLLKKYLRLAEQKDKNELIKSNLKKGVKEILLGLLLIALTHIMGAALILLPTIASQLILLSVIVMASLALGMGIFGLFKVALGCFKLVAGIFSVCFMKNTEQLPLLEGMLFSLHSSPPDYYEVVKNSEMLSSALPTYEQAMQNATSASSSGRQFTDNAQTFFINNYHPIVSRNPSPESQQGANAVCR